MERSYTTKDKSTWGDGPWQSEPDKLQWRDEATGLDCLAVRNHFGAWCGYVGVAPGHRAYKAKYNDVDVRVHGGLTYADGCQAGAEESSVCHVPDPGEPDHVWWLGFDCGHAWDYAPALAVRLDWPPLEGTVYRTLDYVRAEVAALAAQLA